MCEHCTRREFLGASVLAAMAAPLSAGIARGAESPAPIRTSKVRIGVLWCGRAGPPDRGWNTDAARVEEMKSALQQVERTLENVELVHGQANDQREAAAWLEELEPSTPLLAINLSLFALTRLAQPILDRKHPMAVVSLPASGHDWMYPPRWHRAGHRVTLYATSDLSCLEEAIRLLRVGPMFRRARILLFPPARGTAPARDAAAVRERLGCEVVAVDQTEFDAVLGTADAAEVEREFTRWKSGARWIREATDEDIQKAARVSVALQQLVEKYQADALAVGTCMGWLQRGFPCLGFSRLRDRGVPAACEGDMDSLLTMMIFQFAFDQPGFQGNATFDTARQALWTAHCTAPLKLDSVRGQEHPYALRGHSEVGGQGCVPEVFYRVGETITRSKFVNLDTILASTGTIIEVPERSVHGCRTQIVTRVRDVATMVANWSLTLDTEDPMTLLHRVVVYGDRMESLRHLARLMGWKVVQEG